MCLWIGWVILLGSLGLTHMAAFSIWVQHGLSS